MKVYWTRSDGIGNTAIVCYTKVLGIQRLYLYCHCSKQECFIALPEQKRDLKERRHPWSSDCVVAKASVYSPRKVFIHIVKEQYLLDQSIPIAPYLNLKKKSLLWRKHQSHHIVLSSTACSVMRSLACKYGMMQVWHHVDMARCRYGTMQVWHNVGMAQRTYGTL